MRRGWILMQLAWHASMSSHVLQLYSFDSVAASLHINITVGGNGGWNKQSIMECHTTVWIARAQSCKLVFCFCSVFFCKTVLLAAQKKVICTYPCLKEFTKISIMQSLNSVGYHFSKTGKMQNVDNLWSFHSRRDRSVVYSGWRLKLLLYTILILCRHSRSWSMTNMCMVCSSCLSAQVAK